MIKCVNNLSLEQCLELDKAAVWYGSNATHGKPDVPVIYAYYPDGLYEYIGQARIMKSDTDINELYSLQEVRDAIPGKLESVLKEVVKNCLIDKQSIEEMSKCVSDEINKYINTHNFSCINSSINWQIDIDQDKKLIKFNNLSHLYGHFPVEVEAPEPVFQIGDLVLRLNKHTGKNTPYRVISSYVIKKKTKYRLKALTGHKETSDTPNHLRRMTAEEEQQYTQPKQHSHLDLTEF
jgi:hypothetical protein